MRALTRGLGGFLLVGAAAGGGTWLVAYSAGYRAGIPLCAAVGLAVAACWQLARLVLPPSGDPYAPPAADPPGDGLLRLTTLESSLSWGATDPDRFRHRVRPLLAELADERLRTRRGVNPDTHPELARQILGEPLWQLLTVPPDRSPTRAELSRLVAAIERI